MYLVLLIVCCATNVIGDGFWDSDPSTFVYPAEAGTINLARRAFPLFMPPVFTHIVPFHPRYYHTNYNHKWTLGNTHKPGSDQHLPLQDDIEGRSRVRWSSVDTSNEYLTANSTENIISEAEDGPQSRRIFGLANINNAVRPIFGTRPRPFIRNPNSNPRIFRRFSPCDDGNGLRGNCAPARLCSRYGGRPGGVCGAKTICCIHTTSKCGSQITLNNTYWRSPSSISSDSSCSLTVTLDRTLAAQRKPICQIRLDFINFIIAQPDANAGTATVCLVDTFVVGGAVNKVPVICGSNVGQHMYLDAPSSITDVILLFTFGQSNIFRSWEILISMLPCGANYLAPKDCLQYFSDLTGSVKSFNWLDTTGLRQLANQDYQICFRNEFIDRRKSTRICFTPCPVVNGGRSFFLTDGAATSLVGVGTCNTDFLVIVNGFNPLVPANIADRYCGGALNPLAAQADSTVCTSTKDFTIYYKTDGSDNAPDAGNTGFCLKYEQRV